MPPFIIGVARHIDAIQHDAPTHDSPRCVNQSHDRVTRHRFARARLTNEPQDFAARDRKRHVIHSFHHTCLGEKVRGEIFNRQYRTHFFNRGLSTSRN